MTENLNIKTKLISIRNWTLQYPGAFLFLLMVAAYPFTKKTTALIYLACFLNFKLLRQHFKTIIKEPVVICALLFLAWIGLSILWSPNKTLGLHYWHLAADKFLLLLVLPPLFMIPKMGKYTLITFCVSFTFVLLVELFSTQTGYSPFSTDLEAYTALTGLLSSYYCLLGTYQKNVYSKLTCLLVATGMLYLLSHVFVERIGCLIPIASATLLLFNRKTRRYMAVFLIIGTLFLLTATSTRGRFEKALTATTIPGSELISKKHQLYSASIRATEYRAGVKLIQNKPLLGSGLGGYLNELQHALPLYYKKLSTVSFHDRIEDSFLFIAVQTGLLGLFFYCAMLILWGIKYWQLRQTNYFYFVFLPFITYLLTNLFAPQFENHYIGLLFPIVISSLLAKKSLGTREQPKIKK